MYSFDQLRRGVGRGLPNPSFFGRELYPSYHRQLYRWPFNADGVCTDLPVTVPWLIHDTEGDRREITADPPERRADVTESTVADRLRHEGYAQ